jgi:hypothetical protein
MADTSASIPSVPSIPSVAAPPPPPPVTTGLLTRSRAQKVEALTAAPITPPAGPSTSTYAGKCYVCIHRLLVYHMSWDYHVVMISLVPDYSSTFHTMSRDWQGYSYP